MAKVLEFTDKLPEGWKEIEDFYSNAGPNQQEFIEQGLEILLGYCRTQKKNQYHS